MAEHITETNKAKKPAHPVTARCGNTCPPQEKLPQISLVGMGPGNPDLLTVAARRVLREADCLIGAMRLLAAIDGSASRHITLDPQRILEIIQTHRGYERIAVVLSGDLGLYSGAQKLLQLLAAYKPKLYPGISSLQYFFTRLQRPWMNAAVLSLHGRSGSVIPKVMCHAEVFVMIGDKDGVKRICNELCQAGLGSLRVTVGENLSYPGERIIAGTAAEFSTLDVDPLSVLLIDCPDQKADAGFGLPDASFMRQTGEGVVPMTKGEVRAVSLAKLQLSRDAVVYDIGAGTGSVAVEMARVCPGGQVFAIEYKPKALALIEANKKRFGVWNLTVVAGRAPEVCLNLPVPTHAFVGGTSGNLEDILSSLLQMNPGIRIVLNLVTLESIATLMDAIQKLQIDQVDITQISIAKSKKLGKYHLMNGQNPILIVCCQKLQGKDQEKS